MRAHELMRTTLNLAYKIARQKETYAILINNAPELKELSTPEFKTFCKETQRWLKGHDIIIPTYYSIQRDTTHEEFVYLLTPGKQSTLFSFLPRKDVTPIHLEEACNKIKYSADDNGAMVLYKLAMILHPSMQKGGGSTGLQTRQKKDEIIDTFVMRCQDFVRRENLEGRHYSNIEFLELIYSTMSKNGYTATREKNVGDNGVV